MRTNGTRGNRPNTREQILRRFKAASPIAREEMAKLLDQLHATQNMLYATIMELGINRGRDVLDVHKYDVTIPLRRLWEVESAGGSIVVNAETDPEKEEITLTLLVRVVPETPSGIVVP